jgi:hypothetical protein
LALNPPSRGISSRVLSLNAYSNVLACTTECRSAGVWQRWYSPKRSRTRHNPFKVSGPFRSLALRPKHTGLCVHLISGATLLPHSALNPWCAYV